MASQIDQILSKYVSPTREGGSLSGIAFVVKGKGGKTLYSGSAGNLNFKPDSPPYTVDSVSWVASMTKLITSVAALQIVDQGHIGLDDDVGSVIPDLKGLDILEGFDENGLPKISKQTIPVTLRTLLTHSSGFGYDLFDPDLGKWRESNKVEPNSRASWKVPLKFDPGKGWIYGVGIDWAGQIVEHFSGLSLEDYFQKNFFQPLGLKSSTFRIGEHKELAPQRAAIGGRGDPVAALVETQSMVSDHPSVDSGGAGLHTTAADYSTFLGALLDKDSRILKESTYDLLTQAQLADSKYLAETVYGGFGPIMAPEFQIPKPSINHSLVGLVNLDDLPGKRYANSVTWSGVTCPRWWIDPKAGVAATLYTQILPPGDLVVSSLFDELERAVYKDLI
ncbi:hypothetical protein B0A52_08959 [Exophiala mesophila]|uniref:Beta-lactamase-related domain-containing protein n=1 Tax=Exophiala mesophila TaxID=212818 RepID=A0A438MSV4_EXOME|nr:hypothetical protein B0A52_08959 [Exophiala mesophila]